MKLAVLGPKGTYSDIAAQKYIKDNNLAYEIEYYPSILKASMAISNDELAILPFENTLDGFVIESLDRILYNEYNIISQLKLDIDFAFVSNAKAIEDVKTCYVQFKTHGQCIDFISHHEFDVLTTQSNTESLNRLLESEETYGAIIPMHLLDDSFNITIPHIADSQNNETRFFIVSKNKDIKPAEQENLEGSAAITALEDRPGILYEILREFQKLDINLKSIMSRPTKQQMGKYIFFFEFIITSNTIHKVYDLKEELLKDKNFHVDILGIYNRL